MTTGIKAKQGDTIAWDIIWWADAAKGARLDLTGWTVSARAVHETGIHQDMTTIVNDAANGEVGISMSAAQTASMPAGTWKIDIQRRDGSGVTRSTDTFTITIVEDVTP